MTNTAPHQDTPIIVSQDICKRKACQARSDYLARSAAALRGSIREILLACTNRISLRPMAD